MGGRCYGCYVLEVLGADRGILRTWGPSSYLFGSWRVLETFNFPVFNCAIVGQRGGGGEGEQGAGREAVSVLKVSLATACHGQAWGAWGWQAATASPTGASCIVECDSSV